MGDAELLHQWRAGDKRAGQSLIARHYDPVYAFFRAKLGPTPAEDLTQATFERLCINVVDRSLEHGVRPHLFAIARFKLLEYFRRDKRLAEMFDPLMNSAADVGLDRSIVSIIASKRRLAAFYAALRNIPLDSQILLELKHYEQFTAAELGIMFGESEAVMRSRVHRARQRLRDEMARKNVASEPAPGDEPELAQYLDALRQSVAASN